MSTHDIPSLDSVHNGDEKTGMDMMGGESEDEEEDESESGSY
jgi:hypothetical protein